MKREERREKRGAGQRERERERGALPCFALLLSIQLSFALLCVFHHR